MTHDDLLLEISSQYPHNKAIQALYEVVELHSPLLVKDYVDDDAWYECQVCMEFDENVKYPCPTIQAIEKELK